MRRSVGSVAVALLLVIALVGTAVGADRIIIIKEDAKAAPGLVFTTAVFWFPVPAGKELPRPGASSAYAGASAAEIALLAGGQIEEEVFTFPLPNSLTLAQKQGTLQAAWSDRNTYRNSQVQSGENYSATMNDASTWRGDHCPGGLGCP